MHFVCCQLLDTVFVCTRLGLPTCMPSSRSSRCLNALVHATRRPVSDTAVTQQ
jgi:hypothetical protein